MKLFKKLKEYMIAEAAEYSKLIESMRESKTETPEEYESTQTVTKGTIERFCDIKTLEYTTYVKDNLTMTDQEYISRSEAFNKLNTIRMQAEDSKERSVCTRMVTALLEVPVSDVKATRDMVEVRHGYIIEHKGQEDDYYCECSVCKTHEISLEDKYCPECGAKMDGKVEGE